MAHYRIDINGEPWIEDYWADSEDNAIDELFEGWNRAVDTPGAKSYWLLSHGGARADLYPVVDGQP